MKNKGVIQQELLYKEKPFSKYRQVVTGKPDFTTFFLYEIVVSFISPLPGLAGILMRRLFMPFVFKKFGHSVIMERDVSFRKAERILIGDNVHIARGAILDVKSAAGRIIIHDNVRIGRNTIISCPGGTIEIHEGARIGNCCRLGSLEGLIIGSGSFLENHVCVVGAGHEFASTELPIIQQPLTCKGPTIIGQNVIIGRKATVLDGIQVGNNARIKPGSLVNKNIGHAVLAGGIPATSC